MDQLPLADQLDRGLPCWHPTNAPLVRTEIPVFINPAAPNQGTIQVKNGSGQVLATFGRSHYVANSGHDEGWAYDLAVVYWPGCRQYPEATNPQTPRLIKLLYTACNTKSEPRLTEFEQQFNAVRQTSALSPAEEQAFTAIIDLARQGNWGQAQDQCYAFARDQVR